MPARFPSSPRRIALIKPSALGDIAHALPVLTALRQRFPDAHLAWIVNRSYVALLHGHPDLDEVIPFDRHLLRKSWLSGGLAYVKFLAELRGRRFDLAIDLQCLLRTGLMALATGAACRVGLRSAREGARLCYTHLVEDGPAPRAVHAVERYWRVAQALGCDARQRTFALHIDPEARLWAQRALADCPRPWLAVGVGARWLTKRWPPESFGELVRRAQEEVGGTAIFVGAPDEADLARAAARPLSGPVRHFTGQTSLPQLAALLDTVDVMLANDTGPLHLAVALGRPVVAPYTCTRVAATGPYGQEAGAVETSVACAGSYLRHCPHMQCMTELTPERLWPHLRPILLAWRRQAHPAA